MIVKIQTLNTHFTFIRCLPELDAAFYGLSGSTHELSGILQNGKEEATIEEVLDQLEKIYCGSLGVEFMHIESSEERDWFARELEAAAAEELDAETKKEIATSMLISQNFDHFIGAKFPTVKRYGGEGAESCMPFYQEIFKLAGQSETRHLYMCMAHRGRLNLLTGLLNFPLELMFSKMLGGNELPAGTRGN